MTSSQSSDQQPEGGKSGTEKPEWADGLRQLYDSVVDEPLPAAFKDLLAKLDDDGEETEGDGND